MMIVSFYTIGTPYESEADKLRASLQALHIDYFDILGCPNRGSWDLNTKWKPAVILRALNIYSEPVLYVDADATFLEEPELSAYADCDIAAHVMDKAYWGQDISRRRYSLMSGTLYVANTDAARSLLLAWQNENRLEPMKWDQHNLEAVIGFDPQTREIKGPYRFAELPVEYCAIDRTMKGIDRAVIRHHQASRRLKALI